MGLFRRLSLLVALAGAFIGVFAHPANAGTQRAYCHSQGGKPATSATGMAECWVDGVNIYAIKG